MGVFSFIWNSGKSIVNFVQRHKKKVIFTGVLAAAYYIVSNYAKKRQSDGARANEEVEVFRKKQHFTSNQKTCRSTYGNLLIMLKERLNLEIDTGNLTAELRDENSDKIAIWERLKVLSFAKAVCCIYTSCLLYSFSSVVINVLGGYMYVEKFFFTGKNLSSMIQQKYLLSLDYIIGPGLAELSSVVEAAADKVVTGISLKEKLKLEDIEQLIMHIRNYVEAKKNGEMETTRCLLQFLLPPEEECDSQKDSGVDLIEHSAQGSIHLEQTLLLETRDILDSADFHSALAACLNRGFSFLTDNIVEFLPPTKPDNGNNNMFSSIQESEIAMAKLIPIVNGVVNRVMVDRLYDELTADDLVQTFEANVYECFSMQPTC